MPWGMRSVPVSETRVASQRRPVKLGRMADSRNDTRREDGHTEHRLSHRGSTACSDPRPEDGAATAEDFGGAGGRPTARHSGTHPDGTAAGFPQLLPETLEGVLPLVCVLLG